MEETYQDALCQSFTHEDCMKADLLRTQSAMVLQSMYCSQVKGQLAAQEEKEQNGKTKKVKLMGDGLSRYLTGDEFYDCVIENDKRATEEEQAQEERWKRRDERGEALAVWKQAEASRVERNNVRRCTHQEALTAWKAERDLAKAEGRRACLKQPVLGKLESKLPKPTFNNLAEGVGDGNEEESDEGNNSHGEETGSEGGAYQD